MNNTNLLKTGFVNERFRYYEKLVAELTMMSDMFMRNVLNILECAEYVLRVITENDDLELTEVVVQKDYKNLQGRSAVLDCVAVNGRKEIYDIEVQQEKTGAGPKRLRYHSSIIDAHSLFAGEDFEKLPFTWKGDLREAYPLGLQAVPDEEIVRIHSSSGTTGTPIIIPYTQKDVDDWAKMFARCYEMAGITALDRIQITPGYGLWTAGIGFQLGAEHLGAMTIPMGPGNTDKQLRMMQDMKATVLCATSSYALLLAEEIAKRDMTDKVCLKKGVIGSEAGARRCAKGSPRNWASSSMISMG